MKVATSILFQIIIRSTKPDLICDVGAMDAASSKRFRSLSPRSKIIAFEANHRNIALLKEDREVFEKSIEVVECAIWNERTILKFFVEHLRADSDICRRGISSTRSRVGDSLGSVEVEVEAARLDEMILENVSEAQAIVLWIDVEGAAFEVLEGATGIFDRVIAIHTEVETVEIWKGQRLKKDVEHLMYKHGFVELARGANDRQHDVVYIRGRMPFFKKLIFRAYAIVAFVMTALSRLSPGGFRRISAAYLRILGGRN